MATMQGDFTNSTAAARAKAELIRNRIPATHIRVWNILPDSDTSGQTGSGATTGALIGGAVGGGVGFVAGSVIGSALGDDGPHLPLPSGVRVVVDIAGNAAQIEASLRASGATNIRTAK